MRKLIYLCLSLSIVVCLTTWVGCHKNDVLSSDSVTGSVQGRVLDDLGRPVNGASVKSGTASTTTDINGVFRLDNISLNKNAAFVSIEKTGFFKTGRTFLPHASVLNYVDIRLIPKTLKGSFSSSAAGNVTVQTGVTVSFSANSFVTASNSSSYSGTVNFYGGYIDPTSTLLLNVMPGNLMAVNSANQMQLLQTFGMVVGELEGSSGEKLQLASGKTATITMPIPSSMLGSAPATIPMWYFDETTGLWKEEGVATKQGSNYVGTVSHFSFWNCDVPNNYVTLTMTLQNQNGQPLQGYKVVLINTQNNSSGSGYTDANGVVSGAVPPNVTLQMKVYDKCNNLIYTQNIGPFTSSTNLGIITITTSTAFVTITGNVTNCNAGPVANGFVSVYLDGAYNSTTTTANGNFSITIERCSNNSAAAVITATDVSAGQQGSPTSITVASGNYNAGTVSACGTLGRFINYTLNGVNYSFIPPADTVFANTQATNTIVNGRMGPANPSNQMTYIAWNGPFMPGSYSLNYFYLLVYPKQYVQSGPITINVTEYGSVGQYISGNFTGLAADSSTNSIVPVSCNFRVKRLN